MRFLLFFLLCLASLTSWSQTVTYDTIVEIKEVETGVFDTIYFVNKHIQINEEYVVVDTVRGNQWAIDIYGGIPLFSSKTKYTEDDLTLNSSKTSGYYFGGSIYYNFPKNWSVRIGSKFDYQKISSNYTRTTTSEIDVSEEVNDTLDTYFTIHELDTSYFYTIETKVVKSKEQVTEYTDINYNWEIYFLKIPCQVSYAVELKRWNFSFLAGTSLNFQLQRFNSNSRERKENIVSFYPSGIFSLQAGCFIGNSTIIHIEPLFEKSFIGSDNSVIPKNQFSIGIGLKQFF